VREVGEGIGETDEGLLYPIHRLSGKKGGRVKRRSRERVYFSQMASGTGGRVKVRKRERVYFIFFHILAGREM
jgi:hypothetical protein